MDPLLKQMKGKETPILTMVVSVNHPLIPVVPLTDLSKLINTNCMRRLEVEPFQL